MAEVGVEQKNKRIPVTILTGFLGSGKTTLLNWILSADHGKKLAVIENEFGETGVDEAVLVAREHSDEVVVEVKNGCICCTVRGDLVESLNNIYKRTKGQLDGVIIETTGLADPAPVCQSFFVEEDISQRYQIDAVVTIVDAKHIIQHLEEEKPDGVENEAVEQLAFADRVFINKCDLVQKEEHLEAVEKAIRGINKFAPMLRSQFATKAPDMELLLGLDAFDLEKVLEFEPDFLNEDEEHVHDERVSSIGFKLGEDEQLNLYLLQNWISQLIQKYNNELYRYKGVIAVQGREEKFVFQGVHMLFGGDFAANWGPDEERKSCFCFIGQNIHNMGIEEGFRACIAKPLRFKVGSDVVARVAGGFKPGKVIKVWDEGNAYRIKLGTEEDGLSPAQAGVEVWAPADDKMFVRERTVF